MKKILIYFIAFITICFVLPALFTKRNINTSSNGLQEKTVENNEQILNENKTSEYNYNKYGTIKLLHKKTNETEEIKIDNYLYNVVSAEMPADYELEALKAQAIVARTYTIYKMQNKKHENADICDDSTCCQAWVSKEDRLARWEETKREDNWKKIQKCVNETQGKIITYNNQPINAFFHANSGGKTEVPFYVWGGSGYPYLQVVETAGEDAYSQYSSEATFTKEELEKKIKEKHEDFEINLEEENCIEIKERDKSDRVVTVKIGNLNLSGVETRTLLGLRSANFTVDISKDKVSFKVIGYGHGVGMSQTGADALAKQGKNCEEIIKHFYSGVEIKDKL